MKIANRHLTRSVFSRRDTGGRTVPSSFFEVLEPRLLLSGNVTAVLGTNGMLKITGDMQNNEVTAVVVGADLSITPGLGTTINGEGGPFLFAVTDITKILVNLKHGDNILDFDGTGMVAADAKFNFGNGANLVTVTGLETTKNTLIKSGKGGNTITAETLTAGGQLMIKGGNGADTLTVNSPTAAKKLNIMSGKGADVVVLDSITAASVSVKGSSDGTVEILGTPPDNITIKGLAVVEEPVLLVTVTSASPVDERTNVFINETITVTFSESMDPETIATNFVVTDGLDAPVTGAVEYDEPSKTATFTPSANLAINTVFTANIVGGADGVKDMDGNQMESDYAWSFTTGTQIAQDPIDLGAAGTFAVMATSTITSTGETQINGDVGLSPGSEQGIPPAQVDGTINVNNEAVLAAQADLLLAYNDAVSRSETSVDLPGNLGGLTFTPGLYTNSSSVLIEGAGPANIVTLDAQGDEDAIFIFQMSTTLTTGPGAQVVLAGGAKAANVFWQVGSSATLDTTTIFKGNIIASVSITVNTGSVIEGRLLGGANSDGAVTIGASTVTVPLD